MSRWRRHRRKSRASQARSFPQRPKPRLSYQEMYEIWAKGMEGEYEERLKELKDKKKISEDWEEKWADMEWVLVDMPLSEIQIHDFKFLNHDKIVEYVKNKSAYTKPAILDTEGNPMDGRHRLLSAVFRGDKTYPCYVPRRKKEPQVHRFSAITV